MNNSIDRFASNQNILIASTLEDPGNPYRINNRNSGDNPLVATGWDKVAYAAILVIAICVLISVRVFSKQLDNAVVFAFALTAVAIVAFMLLAR